MNTPTLTLEALRIIDEIERRGSFAKAAEHMNKAPSALTYMVQKLEEQLGVSLYQRVGRRSELTKAGLHLLNEGRELLNDAQKLADQTREIAIGWESRIRIAVDTILDMSQLLPAIDTFLQQHPNIELDLTDEVLGGTWEALTEGRVDLVVGVSEPKPQQQGIRTEKIGSVSMVFAVAPQHPLTKTEQPLDPEMFKHHRWVVVHDTSRFSAPRNAGRIGSDNRIYVRSIEQKIALQRAGIGIGYLPKFRIEAALATGSLVELDIKDKTPDHSDLMIAWKVSNRGKGLATLCNLLRQTLK